jgi:dTDP-4-amino-4,6-dideoxygalactose transaminase
MRNQMNVPLLDLKAQYQTIKDEIKVAVEDVLDSQYFILGPKVVELEEAVAAYCDCQQAVGVSSGTDALVIALMAAGIGTGHGVITLPYTFFATAGSIVRVGARPFFVDIDPVTYNIDPKGIQTFIEKECNFDSSAKQLVHRKTDIVIHAIMPVHLYGQCADMDPILALARQFGLLIIEDAAQAIGAEYPSKEYGKVKRAGSMGEFGCLSFFPSKNLGAFGDGGMVTANDAELAEKLKILRVHGSKPKYYHQLVGGNFRLDALQAAVLLIKLKHLDDWTTKRRQNASYYDSLFQQSGLVEKGFITPPQAVWENISSKSPSNTQSAIHNPKSFFHIYNQYVLRVQDRDELKSYLAESGIGTEIYYPLSLHQQECFADLGYQQGDFSESEKAASTTLAIPIYPELEPTQQDYVVEKITSFYTGKR